MLVLEFVCVLIWVLSFLCCVSLGYFVLALLAFVVLSLVSSVLSQKIGWEERLQNDLFCVDKDVNSIITIHILNFKFIHRNAEL